MIIYYLLRVPISFLNQIDTQCKHNFDCNERRAIVSFAIEKKLLNNFVSGGN